MTVLLACCRCDRVSADCFVTPVPV